MPYGNMIKARKDEKVKQWRGRREQAPDLRALTDKALPFYRGKHSKAFFQNLDHIVLRQKLISAVRDKHAVDDIG